MKKIGVIGSGIVGQILASGFIKNGYEVMIGTREEAKLEDWKSKNGPGAYTGSVEAAAKFGDLIVLALKGTAAEATVKSIDNFIAGKTVIDTTNPIADIPPINGVLQFFTTMDESLMQRLQKLSPEANFVKAFNIVGNAFMVNPQFPGGKPTMFICGNNEDAKSEVKKILELFGWEISDLGKAEAAGPIESLCILWCIPGFLRNEWTHAFKMLQMKS